MNNEIKEILAYFEEYIKITDMHDSEPMLNWKDLKIVLDYITNLQEENERLKEVVENLTTMTVCGDRKQIKNTAQFKLEQCQSRIDKAIEYIENTTLFTEDYDYDYEENLVWNGATDEKEREELLNILQGEDNE